MSAESGPKYTPYTQSTAPFSIGLSAIDPANWIEPDTDLGKFLDEKDRLCRTEFDAIFQATPGSEAGQRECLDMLVDHILSQHGDIYSRSGSVIEFAGRRVDLAADRPPLLIAGSLVQDDILILQKRDDGWKFAAGYVAFPSSWSLRDKIGKVMEGVHEHVPNFQGGTRNATMLNRIFDNLQPDLPAMRLNWSIYPERDLFWPPGRGARSEGKAFEPAQQFVRIERQVLRRLPSTGDIAFTVRIYADPIAALLHLPDGRDVMRKLAEKLGQFTPEQLAYKGMVTKKAALTEYLLEQAG